jgi:hypothetical protein
MTTFADPLDDETPQSIHLLQGTPHDEIVPPSNRQEIHGGGWASACSATTAWRPSGVFAKHPPSTSSPYTVAAGTSWWVHASTARTHVVIVQV